MTSATPLALIAALVPLILEAALRALLAAVAVWAGLRLLGIGNVLVQKTAWGLILVAALAMPLAPHWQALPVFAALRIPAFPQFAPGKTMPILQMSTPDKARIATHSAATPVRARAATSTSAPTSNFNALESSTLSASSVPDQALVSEESVAAPLNSDSRNGSIGVGFTPHQIRAKRPQAIAPKELHPQSKSLPIATPQPRASKSNAAPISVFAYGWILYLGVFGALLVRLLVGLASALSLWSKAKPVSEYPGFEPASGLRLRSSSRVASPVNIGSGIVLPAGYAEWDEEKMRVVLAHERSHVRQGDFYLQLLAGFYAALFWFSPLGWWLKRKLSELSEAISDRAGLEVAASRSSYAQLLLEFAALPRPTLTGVAMARTSHLAQRIERLLNESSFRQAFAAGGRRAMLAVFLVPVALFAATAMIRVEAAAAPMPQAQAVPAAQPSPEQTLAGQSTPEQVAQPAPAPAPAPEEVPVPQPAPSADAMPAPPPLPPDGDASQGLAPIPPQPPNPAIGVVPPMPPMPDINVHINPEDIHVHIDPEMRAEIVAAEEIGRQYRGFSYNGEPYAIVGDPGSKPRFIGRWDGTGEEEIEKARKIAHGHFLWFRHDDKAYVVDDPAIVSQIEAMNKPMDDLQTQMHSLGDQMRALGEQQRELGKKMRDLAVPTPDFTRELDELNKAAADLKAKQGGTISQEELGDLQREVGRIQGELGSLQGKIGAQQGALDGGMGKFGGQMGQLGGQMGKLGAEMGQLSRENRSKIDKIVDESLKNGKAKPVQ